MGGRRELSAGNMLGARNNDLSAPSRGVSLAVFMVARRSRSPSPSGINHVGIVIWIPRRTRDVLKDRIGSLRDYSFAFEVL